MLNDVRLSEAAAQFQINVQADGAGAKAVALSWQRQPAGNSIAAHPGVSCLRTNLTAWDTQQLWSPSVRLPDLEAVFRPLESELGMRPIYPGSRSGRMRTCLRRCWRTSWCR